MDSLREGERRPWTEGERGRGGRGGGARTHTHTQSRVAPSRLSRRMTAARCTRAWRRRWWRWCVSRRSVCVLPGSQPSLGAGPRRGLAPGSSAPARDARSTPARRPLDARPRHAYRARSSAMRVASCEISAPMAQGEATCERAVSFRAPYRAQLGRRRVVP